MPSATYPTQDMAQLTNPVRRVTQKQARVASPVGGLNFINSTMDFPLEDAYVLDNMLPRAYGCEIRKGWRNWVPEANKFTAAVKTIMTYAGATKNASRIFACPAEPTSKIYNVTTLGAVPIVSLTPTTAPTVPGEWYFTNYVNISGNLLLVVAAGAGYYIYDGSGDVTGWRRIIDGDGVTPDGSGKINSIKFPAVTAPTVPMTVDKIAFVWIWKTRVWFLRKDSSLVYYLPSGQVTGIAAEFDFGQQLNQGGSLQWAGNWTYDSGDGIDDGLILASTEGQILVYEGTDPAVAASFQMKGRWYAGRFPYGRRNFCDHGGNIVFLCEYGIVSISDLVSGRLHTANLAGSVGYKMNPRLSRQVSENLDKPYWFMHPYAPDEMLVVGTPMYDMIGYRQTVAMNSVTDAWCTFSGMDFLSADVFHGQFIYGSANGTVNQAFFGNLDGMKFDNTGGVLVSARLQGAFNDYGEPNLNKRILRVKLYGRAQADPTFNARYLSEYKLEDPISAPTAKVDKVYRWDDDGSSTGTRGSRWDEALWTDDDGSFHRWFGVAGFGKKLSLQIAMRGAGTTAYTDHEAVFEIGNGL